MVTTEFSWFVREEPLALSHWFQGRNFEFKTSFSRTDYYLPGTGEDLGIKLREGRLEIKERRSGSEPIQLLEGITGFREDYMKWGFDLHTKDVLSEELSKSGKSLWLEVEKERTGLKLRQHSGGWEWVSLEADIPQGCQVEITRIRVQGQQWYSFGLECFGQNREDIPLEILKEMLKDTVLPAEYSMGYASFLNAIALAER